MAIVRRGRGNKGPIWAGSGKGQLCAQCGAAKLGNGGQGKQGTGRGYQGLQEGLEKLASRRE